AQHLGFSVVRIEDRMREILGSADCGLRNANWRVANVVIVEIADVRAAEDGHQEVNVPWCCRFIERKADGAWPKPAQGATRFGRVLQSDFARLHFDPNGVEEILVRDCAAKGLETIRKSTG